MDPKEQFNNDVIYFGFTSSADPLLNGKEVTNRYRKLAKLKHPDKHPGASVIEKEALNEAFKEIGKIYDRIQDFMDGKKSDGTAVQNCEKKFFAKNNFPNQKKASTVVLLQNEYSSEWEIVFGESFGEGKPLTNGVSGKIFKKECFTITLYVKPKSDGKTKGLPKSQG